MRKILIIGAVIGIPVVIVLALVVIAVTQRASPGATRPVTLTFWGVVDSRDAIGEILTSYSKVRQNVTVEYVQKPSATYRDDLLDALASAEAPDLFQIPAGWLTEYAVKGRIVPAPDHYTVAEYTTKTQLFKKVTSVVSRTVNSLTVAELQRNFAPSVYEDGVVSGKIYGLPFAVDSLALFSNRDLINLARVAEPPKTWDGLRTLAANPNLRVVDAQGTFVRSAVALGAASIPHATDILTGLMVQGGATLIDPAGKTARFADEVEKGYNAGLAATELYTSFASPGKETYSWNDQQGDALTAFTDGRVALFLGYRSEMDRIVEAAPQLPLDVTPMLHLNTDGTDRYRCSSGGCQPYNIASNWVAAVSKQSDNPNEAWDLIQFVARRTDVQLVYAQATKRAPVLKAALEQAKTGGSEDVWVDQAFTAHTWYHGNDAVAADRAIEGMIESVVSLKASPLDALSLAANQVSETLR